MLAPLKTKLARSLRQQLVRAGVGLRGGVMPEREVIYQNIFDRDLSALSVPNNFYPLNAAANYSLLYLILRAAQELNLRSIVELGAGQSSRLIDALRKRDTLKGDALTIDHDEEWAARTRAIVSHRVVTAPLVARSEESYSFQGYDLSKVNLPEKIDFLLIDGPLGWGDGRTFARLGALPILDRLDPEGFVVIVDDAEREGEKMLADRIQNRLEKSGVNFKSTSVVAAKRQEIFASGRMLSAAFY